MEVVVVVEIVVALVEPVTVLVEGAIAGAARQAYPSREGPPIEWTAAAVTAPDSPS